MEERWIDVALEDADQRGGTKAERRAAERAIERERVERFGPRQDRDRRPGPEASRLEVREQARVLLGLLGDAVDRRPLPRRDRRERFAAWPAASRLEVDRVAVGARLGMAEELVELGLETRRHRCLESLRLVIRLGPTEPDDLRQEPLAERVSPEDPVRRGSASRREPQLAARGAVDQSLRAEASEHLARGLSGDAEPPRDLCRADVGVVVRERAHREEVLLRRAREIAASPPAIGGVAHGLADCVPRRRTLWRSP